MRRTKRLIDAPEFARWKADWIIDPWGNDWRQAATIAAEVHNAGAVQHALQAAAAGHSVAPDIRQVSEFIPFAKKIKPKKERRRTADESEAVARARYG